MKKKSSVAIFLAATSALAISSAEHTVTQSEASLNSTTKKINTFYASLLDAQNYFCEDIVQLVFHLLLYILGHKE